MRYKIYEEFYNDVEKKLKRVEKKCVKYGNPFTFEIVGEEIKEVVDKETKKKTYYKFIIVDVEGTAKIDNWECIAVLEVHETGNIIRRINTEIEVPSKFKYTKNFCEHCNSKRQRNNLYIIHNIETDEWKQVGGNCLNLYTNGLNMEYITSYIDGITTLEENNGIFCVGGKSYYSVKEVISFATEVIAKTGYFNSDSFLPTKWLVSDLIFNSLGKAVELINKELKRKNFYIEFCDKDFLKEDTESLVEKIIEYYKNLEDDSEFIHNIKVMLNEEYVLSKNFGFLCYLPEGYNRYIKKEIEKAKQKNIDIESEHFGVVDSRYKDLNVYDIKILTSYETIYGITYVYKITLESGNILIWKSSKWFENLDNVNKITFTVKSHGEYNKVKQTEVTRCKLNMKQK